MEPTPLNEITDVNNQHLDGIEDGNNERGNPNNANNNETVVAHNDNTNGTAVAHNDNTNRLKNAREANTNETSIVGNADDLNANAVPNFTRIFPWPLDVATAVSFLYVGSLSLAVTGVPLNKKEGGWQPVAMLSGSFSWGMSEYRRRLKSPLSFESFSSEHASSSKIKRSVMVWGFSPYIFDVGAAIVVSRDWSGLKIPLGVAVIIRAILLFIMIGFIWKPAIAWSVTRLITNCKTMNR
ncbi:MAG: hypothetical protein L0I37_13355 [Lactococcus lactis]|uniref:Uncharacterized protein n=1 Tax=Geotrichum candidum TaxID=1173061 RepID=A0A0J9XIE6_GEOCN|nr:hypothetical protein [Lactococcus lactis]CDO57307.1 Hypothetical protein, no similarity [Geotrichum candidum]